MADSNTIRDFGAGWVPSDDAVNGRKNGLLQMDNLELDKNGALSLQGGTTVEGSAYANAAHTIFSNIMNGLTGGKKDYVADVAGNIFRNGVSIGSGGSSSIAAFSTAFDFTLIASGATRLKDSGASTTNLGLVTPPAPGAAIDGYFLCTLWNTLTQIILTGNATVIGGNSQYGNVTPDPTTLTFVVQSISSSAPAFPIDATAFVAQNTLAQSIPYTSDPTDFFQLGFVTSGTAQSDVLSNISSITVDILLDTPNSSGDPVADFFTFTYINGGHVAARVNFNLAIQRGQFTRVGQSNVGWSAIQGFRITIVGSSTFNVGEINFFNGIIGGAVPGSNLPTTVSLDNPVSTPNTGSTGYQFAQMNVNQSTNYTAKSQLSPATGTIYPSNNTVRIFPNISGIESQVNQIWIFARGNNLGAWYRVAVFTSGNWSTPQFWATSDEFILTVGITVNLNLVSANSTGIAQAIIAIVGPMEGRWFYFTTTYCYPSDINDPDLVDTSIAVRTTGSTAELFLWAQRISNNSVLVGTSRDVYVLQGTFVTLPDGTIDVYYQSLGCKHPPITYDSSQASGSVYYLAADGWRSIDQNGNCILLVAPNTDRLYRGETAYGYSVNVQVVPGSVRFPCVVARNKLWCGITGQARMEVLDPTRQYWRNFSIGKGDCLALCSTQDGQILGFFASDNKLRQIDQRSNLKIDGATNQTISILFPVSDGGTPKQRHELYTVKIRLQTGSGETLTVTVFTDGGTSWSPGTVTSNGVVTEQILDLSQVIKSGGQPVLTRNWQLLLSGNFSNLTIDDITFEFDTRPVQLTHLHLLPENYGTTGRKRIPTVPFVIDCLGNGCTYTPIVDGAAQTPLAVNTSRKQSVDYEFTADVPGVDWEFVVDGAGALFEFFGNQTAQYIEKLPEPAKYHWIPISNLGSPNKKRVRVWMFVIDTLGNDVTFQPVVDGSNTTPTIFNGGKQTFYHFFKTDVFGVDYGGSLSGGPFELYEVLPPDVVQTLPQVRQFDQVGPEELFRYGRIKQFEYRVMPFGTSIPWTMYFNDNQTTSGSITCISGLEQSFFIGVPMGQTGTIVRVVFGPTSFNFHRFYVRLQVMKSGRDTDLEWVTIPDPGAGE